ncbi:MAG: 2-hydroxyacyl-CoA dehydratase subunit D [Bacillota bacterium]
MSELKGLAKAQDIYFNRSKRAQELKAEGQKVVGQYCCYVPREILTAAGLVSHRITGDIKEPITQADTYLETIMCPLMRSTFDLALKGKYDFLDGVVVPHSCDSVERMLVLWRYYFPREFNYYLNVPHMTYEGSFDFFREELRVFAKKVGEYVGKEITDEALKAAIALHNENRQLLRQMYDLRKQDPPLISGGEALQIVMAGMVIPVEEHNQIIRDIMVEVKERPNKPSAQTARVLVYASDIDHSAFVDLVEQTGGNVVMDDQCIGTRTFWHDVKITEDPYQGLADCYLGDIRCPRTFRYGQTAADRFQYLVDYAEEFNVNSVILYVTRFCDIHELDVPDIRDIMQAKGYPVLHIEDDYSATTIGQLKTRVQAFLEMVI